VRSRAISFWGKLFGKGSGTKADQTKADQTKAEQRDPAYEKVLQDEFGLELIEVPQPGWQYSGLIYPAQDLDQSRLRDPQYYFDLIKALRNEYPFGRVCLIFGKTGTSISCDHKPPIHIMTPLDLDKGTDLALALARSSGSNMMQLSLNEYKKTLVVKL
jgi:hypothetical protein